MGIFILIVTISGIMPELDHLNLIAQYPWLLYIFFNVGFLVGPCIYFYTHSLVAPDKPLSNKKYLNFLPALLDMKYQVIYLFYLTGMLNITPIRDFYFLKSTQHFFFSDPGIFKAVLAIVLCLIYTILSYRLVLRYADSPEVSAYKLKDVKWLKTLLKIMMVLIGVWAFTIFLNNNYPESQAWNYYFMYIPILAYVYWLGMSTYMRQRKMSADEIVEYNNIPVKNYFSDDTAEQYTTRLLALMQNEKPYLNPQLKVDDLAAKLVIPEKQASSLLNQHLGKNFNDFVNAYRVEEAKKHLVDPHYDNFTIAAIAYECGFNSLATFQRCFKQFTDTTPSSFQNNGRKLYKAQLQ
jgi:AraC-like DNA-binding protein